MPGTATPAPCAIPPSTCRSTTASSGPRAARTAFRTSYACAPTATLCADCHALAHGIDLRGVEMTQADMEQAITEYLADYYAPDWNPWGKEGP